MGGLSGWGVPDRRSVYHPPPPDIVDGLRRVCSRRKSFGTAGAALTWGIDGIRLAPHIQAGLQGEQLVGFGLDEWVAGRSNAAVVHSVRRPDSDTSDTDHVLVVGRAVILVDAKRWKPRRKYSVNGKGNVVRGKTAFPEGKLRTRKNEKAWRDVLPEGTVVRTVVCVAQDEVFVVYDDNWKKAPFTLVSLEQLPHILDRQTTVRGGDGENEPANGTFTSQIGEPLSVETLAVVFLRHIKPRPSMAFDLD